MREWENEVNANNTKQPTLPKFQTLAKFEMKKRRIETVRRIRKETEEIGRDLRENLMKKGCKKGGVSL
ncbi:hypothetical protein [Capnocytophaga sp. oral taxon 336]|uniref:hypothetical protein n=1 Tax=Capnocytophaga sp. oral taxon 336 TaxID=712216 RepID=UPI00034E63A2|nr:hypothetical protein [Capnocytophaga sp. oral taxon 336]EPE01516.1 hypothetical protein HMPREF1528_00347 [Capnocytophaga sp. oral taxon 336 str. F0502]